MGLTKYSDNIMNCFTLYTFIIAGGAAVYPISVAYLLTLIPDYPIFIAVWPVFNVIGTSIGYASGGMLLKLKADIEQPTSFLSNKGGEQFGAWVSYLQKKKFFLHCKFKTQWKANNFIIIIIFL